MSPADSGGWRARWRRAAASLRWRLVALFVLLAAATVFVFVAGMREAFRDGGWRATARPLIAHYSDLATAELGVPPSVERARALAERLPLRIRIDGPEGHWDSHPERAERARLRGLDDDSRVWQTRVLPDGHRVSFGLAPWPHERRARGIGWATLAALLLFVGVAWWRVSRLLAPIEGIRAGAERYGRGDFGTPIGGHGDDELGRLARQVDGMAAELRRMLESQRGLLLAIGHELRSPLTRARVNAELVEDGQARDALLRDLAEMRDLISDLLDSERLAAGPAALHTEPTELVALLRESVAEAGGTPPVRLELPEATPPLPIDRPRLRLLLRNLLGNARRHAAGRAVELSLQPQAREGRAGWLLTVRDHGPGVGDAQRARLAEPFYRTDTARQRRTGGVGLGLYLCRLVAQAHGGTIAFDDAAPGLAVRVWLPA